MVDRAMAGSGQGAWWSAEVPRDGEWRGLPTSSVAPPGFDMLRSRVQTNVGLQPYHQSQQVRGSL